MKRFSIALDWTPNINHIGFFVAQKKGFYVDAGLEVEIISPDRDNYEITPAKKIETGVCDFALCPTESIISYRSKKNPFPLIGIAAILQSDLSAIVTKSASGINSPKHLDGKTYASYKARYEDGIVREMIKYDGGDGNLKILYPAKLGIWDTVLKDKADATWIFINWEGIEAKNSDIKLNYFALDDYGIPYSYSPVIATNALSIQDNLKEYRDFLQATKKGFLYSGNNKNESIEILRSHLPDRDKDFDLNKALEITSLHFGNEDNWGRINEKILTNFLHWLEVKGLEKSKIEVSEIFTNDCMI